MKLNWTKVGGAVLVVSSLLAGWMAIDAQVSQDRFIDCLTERLSARDSYANADRASLKLVFVEVEAAVTPAQSRQAVAKYIASLNETDRLRSEKPIPTSVRACG